MTTIQAHSGYATLINLFTVEPENRQKLVALLKEGTETLISRMAGWISTNFLDSRDGRRVIIYSQWRSVEDIEAMRQNSELAPYFQRLAALATFDAIECAVSDVHHV